MDVIITYKIVEYYYNTLVINTNTFQSHSIWKVSNNVNIMKISVAPEKAKKVSLIMY